MRLGLGIKLPTPRFRPGGSAAPVLPSVAAAPIAAYSLTKVISGFSGIVATVCATGAADTPASSIDVSSNADGTPDLSAAIAAYGNTFHLWKLYDQTGTYAEAVASTAATRPIMYATLVGSKWSWFGNGNQRLSLPAAITMSRRDATLFSVAAGPNTASSSVQLALIGLSTTNSAATYANLISSVSGLSGLGDAFKNSFLPLGIEPTVAALVMNASNTIVHRDGYSLSTTAFTAATGLTGGFIGRTAGSLGSTSQRHYADIIYPALSSNDVSSIKTALATIFAIPTRGAQVIFDGDSIQYGQGSTEYQNKNYHMIGQLTGNPYQLNVAVPGQSASGIVTAKDQNHFNLLVSRAGMATNVYVINAGSNDLAGGVTAATLWGNVNTLIGRAQTAGFTVVVEHVIVRDDLIAAEETERQAYNALLESNKGSGGFTTVAYGDTAITRGDGTHPTTAGYLTMSEMAVPVISAALAA